MRVEVKQLSMNFIDGGKSIEVFSNLNFVFESGNSIAVVGESGVGKTTLLSILGGLELPTAGSVKEIIYLILEVRKSDLSFNSIICCLSLVR
jgi:ABC-type lipoprotein export system ATPase subunit